MKSWADISAQARAEQDSEQSNHPGCRLSEAGSVFVDHVSVAPGIGAARPGRGWGSDRHTINSGKSD